MKKKLTILALSALMAATVATGCAVAGGNSSISSSISSSSSESSSVITDITYEISVCFDDNSAAANCPVTVTLNGETKASGTTNAEGKFTFKLAPAEYTVTVTAPDGYAADPITVNEETAIKTIKLRQTGALDGQIAYLFYVYNDGDFPMENITVKLVQDDGTTVIKNAETNEDGLVMFYMQPGSYNVTLDNLPTGYSADAQYKLTDNVATPVIFTLTPSLLQGETMPSGTKYTYGSVMYDFTAPLSDGTTWSLYEALETKKVVLVNFWATWCGPCASEFPAMDATFGQYQDDVDVVCLSTESGDSLAAIAAYKQQRGIKYLQMGSDANDMYGNIQGLDNSVPVTLVIDRNGVLCEIHEGAKIDLEFYIELYEKFIVDDYTTLVGIHKNNGGNNGAEEEVRDKPDVEMTPTAEIEALINNTQSGYTFSYTNYPGDEYSWPWVIQNVDLEDGNGTQQYFGPSNSKKGYSYSILCSEFTATAGQVLAFDYWMQTEETYDEVYVQIDGVIQYIMSGNSKGWKTCYAYVAPENGEYLLTILYNKDQQGNFLKDNIYIKNMRFISASEVESDTYIKRYAATHKNPDAPDSSSQNWGSVAQYNAYITPVFNEDDGYYHVGDVNGPLLLADLMYATPWSDQYTIWNLAYAGYFVINGYNYKPDLEQYACQQNNSDLSVLAIPVDGYLQYLIETAMDHLGFKYDNAWLEVCVYYNYYGPKGDAYQLENPIAGIDFISAYEVEYEAGSLNEANEYITFTADIRRQIVPRGYKYAFIPEVDGIYQIESISTDTNAYQDTMAWIFDENQNMIAENSGAEFTNGYNFGFRMRLEAGKTYYIACGYFAVDYTGSYNVKITYHGETFYTWQVGALTYSYTMDGAEYLSDAVEYMLDADGYYYVKNSDGTKGAPLYINMFAPSKFSPIPQTNVEMANGVPATLRNYINKVISWTDENGNPKINPDSKEGKPYYNVTEQGFNFKHMLDDKGNPYPDYLDEITAYLAQAEAVDPTDKYYGYIRADKQIAEILRLFFNNLYDSDLDNHWLLLAFYEKSL